MHCWQNTTKYKCSLVLVTRLELGLHPCTSFWKHLWNQSLDNTVACNQCRSQDEQVTWAQHEYIQCACYMHLLVELGHTPAMKIIHPEITSEAVFATNTTLSVLPVCLLHIHMKAIAHANSWSLTLAFRIIFTQAPLNFTWAQAWVCRV